MMSWQHRKEDDMILNVDGSALINPSKVNNGGLIWKHDGSFQLGYLEVWGYQISYMQRFKHF
jgi:hypothetical protein